MGAARAPGRKLFCQPALLSTFHSEVIYSGMDWEIPERSDGHLRPIAGFDDGVFVSSYPALIQAAGYPKYLGRGTHFVTYRGEAQLHPTLVPSLYRGIGTLGTARDRLGKLRSFTKSFQDSSLFLTRTPEWARAPLLQHYGVRTDWLDLVDNYWVALWFALHDIVATGPGGRFLSIRRRRPDPVKVRLGTETLDGPLGFIHVIAIESPEPDASRPGVIQNSAVEMIDLRVAAPSLYLRPHSQHGLLVHPRSLHDAAIFDLSSMRVCTLVVPVVEALSWIGGTSLEHLSIFPSPHDDPGYHKLLGRDLTDRLLGAVSWVGY